MAYQIEMCTKSENIAMWSHVLSVGHLSFVSACDYLDDHIAFVNSDECTNPIMTSRQDTVVFSLNRGDYRVKFMENN